MPLAGLRRAVSHISLGDELSKASASASAAVMEIRRNSLTSEGSPEPEEKRVADPSADALASKIESRVKAVLNAELAVVQKEIKALADELKHGHNLSHMSDCPVNGQVVRFPSGSSCQATTASSSPLRKHPQGRFRQRFDEHIGIKHLCEKDVFQELRTESNGLQDMAADVKSESDKSYVSWNYEPASERQPRKAKGKLTIDKSKSSLASETRKLSFASGSSELMRELLVALNRIRPRSELTETVWEFLEDPATVSGGRTFLRLMSVAILVSAVVPVLRTVEPPLFDDMSATTFEIALDCLFAIEVLVRFMTCPNRLAFCVSLYNLIDIAAGLLVLGLRSVSTSSLIDANSKGSSTFVMLLICSVPILRLLKLLRRFETFHLILRAFRLASEALPVLLFILSIILLIFASIIYIVEPRENIASLPEALWLTIVTVGTVGYGDKVPTSITGGIVVSILIVVSALYMAIPIGIVGREFASVWDDRDRLMLLHRARTRFLSRGYRAEDIPTLFCSFDVDGDGKVSLPEFLSMMSKLQIDFSGERAVDLFNTFDIDGSGAIDDSEFVRTLFPAAFAEIYGTVKSVQLTTDDVET